MKKFFALLLALALVMSLAPAAFAADTPVSLTVSHIEDGHTFTAYQILDGDVFNRTLSNITWGKNVDGDALLAALRADTTTLTDSATGTVYSFATDFATAASAEDFARKISLYASNNVRILHLSNLIAETSGVLVGDGTDSVMDPIATQAGTYTYTISNLDPGYYIVVDTTQLPTVDDPNTPEDETKFPASDFRTNYMVYLTSAGNISTKGSTTTTEKSVSPRIDGTYDHILAAELNEVHYYKLETDINNNLNNFDKYTLVSYDQMGKGLTFLALEEVYVLTSQGAKHPLGTKSGDTFVWGTNPNNVSYKPDRVYNVPAYGDEGTANNGPYLAMGWEDTKVTMPSLQPDDTLVIIYSAKMNENAVMGIAGNLNEHYVDATNGPGSQDMGQTIHDKTRVFTFQLDVLKVDANDDTKTLAGAEFYLMTNRYDANTGLNVPMYAQFTDVTDASGKTAKKLTGWAPYFAENIQQQIDALNAANPAPADKDDQIKALEAILADPTQLGTKLVTGADGHLNVDGLNDSTSYELIEVKAPDGYNLPLSNTRVVFEYTTRQLADGTPTWNRTEGTVKRDADGVPVATGLRVAINGQTTVELDPTTAAFTQALGSVNIENNQGDVLPSTGGVGTTMLYVFGTILTLGAAILLITKRRMNIA